MGTHTKNIISIINTIPIDNNVPINSPNIELMSFIIFFKKSIID